MTTPLVAFVTSGLLLAFSVAPGIAESINPPTTPQTAPMTAQEKKNLDMVLNWWHEVLDGGHLELTSKYQAEDYIQHSPNVPSGRAGFVAFFSKFAKPKNPIPDKLSNPPVVMGRDGFKQFMSRIPGRRPEDAKPIQAAWINAPVLTLIDGPYSLMMWDRTAKDPDDPGREYHWDHFDLVRAQTA